MIYWCVKNFILEEDNIPESAFCLAVKIQFLFLVSVIQLSWSKNLQTTLESDQLDPENVPKRRGRHKGITHCVWWRISWILNFTCLDAILFTKVAHTLQLFQHISEKQKPLSLLQFGLCFPRTSIFWTWWRILFYLISLVLTHLCLRK